MTNLKVGVSSTWMGCRMIILGFTALFYSYQVGIVHAKQLKPGLSDPFLQPKFVETAPNALDPSYIAQLETYTNDMYRVSVGESNEHSTGLIYNGEKVNTTIYGYGQNGKFMWPGSTFVVKSSRAGGPKNITVIWTNELRPSAGRDHLLPVDTSIHWAYSLVGYTDYKLSDTGVPIIPHLHGGYSNTEYDGHAAGFFTPDGKVVGPFWDTIETGFTNEFIYDNSVRAAPLWYHDHTLGLTRLNVYAGMAGFYFIRDNIDTGDESNPLGLPSGEYELAYAIQDRMFKETGELFMPAFHDDPSYSGYIDDEGVVLPDSVFPHGGPSALAEFFGDHIVVNGKLWPKANVRPKEYRLRLLNGCDSRYLVIRFMKVPYGSNDPTGGVPLNFTVIGSDGGLGTPKFYRGDEPLVIEVAGRYDIIINFGKAAGSRVILQNLAGDGPFGGHYGGDLEEEDLFEDRQTDKIMAWDVDSGYSHRQRFVANRLPCWKGIPQCRKRCHRTRMLTLLEGRDPFGRIQPMLGAATNNPNDPRGLFAAYGWHHDTTEKPKYMTTEDWYFINLTVDAHAMHVHLFEFFIVKDFLFTYVLDGDQVTYDHMGNAGTAPRIKSISNFTFIDREPQYYDRAPKDVVTVLPGPHDDSEGESGGGVLTGRGTVIRMKFDKLGRFAWHCHILSHEDHSMMRPFEVIP